jgi:hypothetical protein
MKKTLIIALALATGAFVSTDAFAQGAQQTLVKYNVNVTQVASGYRASKVIGASVVNDANDKIGSIDDLIVTRDDRIVYAIISVGGFLGIGDKLVAIPFAELQLGADKTVLPGGTKDALKALPKFVYAK